MPNAFACCASCATSSAVVNRVNSPSSRVTPSILRSFAQFRIGLQFRINLWHHPAMPVDVHALYDALQILR
jgi:hypothetical protein